MKLCQILYDLHYYLLLGRGFFGFFIWCKLFLVGHDVFFLIFMNNSLSVNPAKEITKAKHSMKICWMHSLDHHQKYHNTAVTHKVGGGAVPGRSPFFNCLQVLKGSTWETFNKRANLIKHEWRFIRPAPCFVIPLVVWILDETGSYSCLQYRIGQSSQDKSKTMLMQTSGGKAKSIIVLWKRSIKRFYMTSRLPKQWNSGHVGVPNQSCGSWTLFLC